MYGGGEFDGGGYGDGGFGGGGFDTSGGLGGTTFQNSQGGGFQVDNSGPDGKARGGRDKASLIPVTIKQLKNANEHANGEQGFTIDGRDLHQVSIVGIIQSAEEQNTNLQFTIDDGTDHVIVKMWTTDTDTDEEINERRAAWKEGKIVRVVGQLRKFNQSRCLVAFHIRPLTDFNEYTFHFVEAIHTHLNHTKGPVPAGMPGAAPGAGMMGGMGGGMGGPPAGGIAAQPAAGANLQDTVLTFFNSYPDSETGMTVDACHQAMRASGVTLEQIKATVEHLVAEGHVYSTIDEQHYKGTM